jgi:transcription initiation factor TFIIB
MSRTISDHTTRRTDPANRDRNGRTPADHVASSRTEGTTTLRAWSAVTAEEPHERRAHADARSTDGSERRGEPICPECDEPTFDDGAAHHELVCGSCGLVLDTNYVDHGPEWRAYSYDEYESKSRTGAPMTNLRHDRGLTTTIDWRDEDAAGNALSERGRRRAGRLRQWQRRLRTQGSGERILRQILGEVTRMASALGVPESTRQIAAAICGRAVDESVVRGWSVEGIATSALYAACRRNGAPRSLDEMTAVSRIDRRTIGRTYKHLTRELGIDLEPPHPRQYVSRICSDLGLPESVLRRARDIIDRTADAGLLSGKSPTGYAGGAVFAAALLAGYDCTKGAAAEAADVTVTTIRTHARDQLETVGTPTIATALLDDDVDLPPNWRQDVDGDSSVVDHDHGTDVSGTCC